MFLLNSVIFPLRLKPNSSIFGSYPNISIWYSVAYQIYLVDIWSIIRVLFHNLVKIL